jgi:hypothetical protein
MTMRMVISAVVLIASQATAHACTLGWGAL